MKILPVIDKYTYNKPHQTSYEYDPLDIGETENVIKQRMQYIDGPELFEGLCPFTLCDCGIPKNSFQLKTLHESPIALGRYSGIKITYTCTSEYPVQAYIRLEFARGEETFMSAFNIYEGTHTAYFTTDVLSFPDDVKFARFEVLNTNNNYHIKVVIESANAVYILDPFLRFNGQTAFFKGANTDIAQDENGLSFNVAPGAKLISPEFPDTSASVFNMLMPLRNTLFFVISNNSSADHVIVSYRTTKHSDFCSKRLDIIPYSGPTAYYCNLSDTPNCDGRLAQFAIETENGCGSIHLRRFTFEQEKAIEECAGTVQSCISDGKTVTIKGTLGEKYRDCTLALYQTTMADGSDSPAGKIFVTRTAGAENFKIEIPFYFRGVSRISCQLYLVAEMKDGRKIKVADRFYIDNKADFLDDRYKFSLPDYTVSVESFGAVGNGFTDDTEAIQRAIDAVNARGGGKVVVPGDGSFYGRRFIITSILMRSNVELHIEKGAILWQDQDPKDYTYRPFYGHDGYIEGVNWTHALHIMNLPLIQITNLQNVKLTGPGKIRSLDIGSIENIDMPGYATGCPDRIHAIPVGCFNNENMELSDFELVRTNNYHIAAYHCANVRITGIKMYEVKCVSGDGIGVGASHHIYIANNQFQSNDDGVTITAHYHDPRGIFWWACDHNGPCATRHLLIEHCYMNSGGGKAIAFIPWGTTQDYAEDSTIFDVEVRDCTLVGVNPVGAWADNPYAGKIPFDNTDIDDYSPVMSVRIHDNRYEGDCKVYPLKMTDFISDCGLKSSSEFLNGDFTLGGFANWNRSGDVVIYRSKDRKEGGTVNKGELYEGLCLEPGKHIFKAVLTGGRKAVLFVKDAITGEILASSVTNEDNAELAFETASENTWYIGISSDDGATLLSAKLESDIDFDAINDGKKKAYKEGIESKFDTVPGTEIILNKDDGKLYFEFESKNDKISEIISKDSFGALSFKSAIRVIDAFPGSQEFSYGLFAGANDGGVIRATVFYTTHSLEIAYEKDGARDVIYHRENFFFTSNDFHSFDAVVDDGNLTLFIDKGRYLSVSDSRLKSGKCGLFCVNGRLRISGLSAE